MVGEVRVRQGLSGTTTVTACLSTIYHQGVPRACACPPFITKPCRYCQESDTEDSAEHWNDEQRGLSDNVRDKEDDEKKKIWI